MHPMRLILLPLVLVAALLSVAAPASAGGGTSTTYVVTQCLIPAEFNVEFWQTGQMEQGAGTIGFDVYRYDAQHDAWVYFGHNADTIRGFINAKIGAGPMHGEVVLFASSIGDFVGTWSAGMPGAHGIGGVGQIVARSLDGGLLLRTPKGGTLDASAYPASPCLPGFEGSVNEWIVLGG